MHRAAAAGLLLLLTVGALLFRLPALDNRPMHGDEAVHAFKFEDVWEKGVYHYDPQEFHGPTLYYAAIPSVWLHGRRHLADTTEADFRIVTVVFGAGLVLLLALLARGLGWPAAVFAALLTAISPAFVFYSRYYIQETLLAFFTLAAIGCGWRYVETRRPGWAAVAGLSAGLMVATKETSVFAFVAMAAAVGLTAIWTRRFDGRVIHLRSLCVPRPLLLTAVTGVVTAFLFLSGFLTNLRGPFDFFRSFTPWAERAAGTTLHQYPWYHYFSLLLWTHRGKGPVWTEAFILALAAIGSGMALMRQWASRLDGNINLIRFLAFYTLVLTLIYTVIPYKTPWCVLSFLDGMILLAGVGAAGLIRAARTLPLKVVIAALLVLGCGHLTWLAYNTIHDYESDEHNPYAFAQPSTDVVDMAHRVESIARATPQGRNMVVMVISHDAYYWPIPWYLRQFPNVGYFTEVPSGPLGTVILASPDFDAALQKRLSGQYKMTGYNGLRPAVFYETWVKMDAWKAHLEQRRHATTPEDE
ncbi:MAG: TIGR03663 family protein [Armatimonadota bacterium]|nr:TIGR03663 family protein [Armatimonadota bacterium]